MSEYTAIIRWQRGEQDFTDLRYSRAHTWEFDGGLEVPASSSPRVVPVPMSVAANLDPEEAFVASLSSCHMLFFLSLAAGKKFTVDTYLDKATGIMETDSKDRTWMTRVVLRPEVKLSGSQVPAGELEKLHEQAHNLCFIANSVKTEISIEIVT